MNAQSLLVALLLIYSAAALDMRSLDLKHIQTQLKPLEQFHARTKIASEKHGFQYSQISVECGVCGIAINEIEGFMAENLTVTEIESKIDSNLCSILGGSLASICDRIVGQLPTVIAMIEQYQSVGVVCVEMGICQKPFSPHSDPQVIPSYTIDLDLPAAQRWTQVCSNETFQNIAQYLVNTIVGILPDGGVYLNDIGEALNLYYFPTEYAQEIQGCAQQLNVPYGWLTILNLGYEVSDACTSIIAQTPDGKILHARNLDFWDGMGFTDSLKDLAFQATFTKGGKPYFYATSFAGFVGVLSGMKPNGFSVTIDTRFYPQGISQMFYEVVAAIMEKNASLVTFLSRDVFMNENTFEAAVNNLANDALIADVYYIVAGVSAGQGAVISRNRLNATDIWRLDSPTRWFEVETNYDHWKQAPWFDDRVVPANNAMNAIGQADVSLEAMFKVLSIKPVLNLQTTYSILACPADGTYQAWTRYCPYPCVE